MRENIFLFGPGVCCFNGFSGADDGAAAACMYNNT